MTRPPSGESSTRSLRRLKTEKISISDREQLRGDALQIVQDGEADTLDEQDETAALQFGTDNGFVDSLTPLRLELNWAITEEVPKSIRKTARLIERNVSDVHSDLKQLEVLGILTLEVGGPSGAIQSIAPFGCIDSLPIDSGDAGGTHPSAKSPLTARRVHYAILIRWLLTTDSHAAVREQYFHSARPRYKSQGLKCRRESITGAVSPTGSDPKQCHTLPLPSKEPVNS